MAGCAFSAAMSTVGAVIMLLVDAEFLPVPAIHQLRASEPFWTVHLFSEHFVLHKHLL